MTTCGCLDPGGLDGFGEDLRCYCPKDYEWRNGRCIYTIETESPPPPPPPLSSQSGSIPPGDPCEDFNQNPSYGNPVFPLTGTKNEVLRTGIFLGGIELTLTYTTYNLAGADGGATVSMRNEYIPAGFGFSWFSNFHRTFYFDFSAKSAIAVRGEGRIVSFHSNERGYYIKHPSIRDYFSSPYRAWVYTDPAAGTIEAYENGKLAQLSVPEGSRLWFAYSASASEEAPVAGLLTTVHDAFGRTLSFTYRMSESGKPFVHIVTGPDGQRLTADYDGNDNLASLTWADGRTRTFLYEREDLPWALTGVVDESGVRYASFGYDERGHARSTELAGGVNRYEVSYATPPQITTKEIYNEKENFLWISHDWKAPTGTRMTLPNGSKINLEADPNVGVARLTSRSQPAGAGCGASISHQAFDVNGNLVQRDDFNGTRTCIAYDMARNLPVRRIEGLPNTLACSDVLAGTVPLPEGVRHIHTEWHPRWDLPVRRAEAGLISTYVYNAQPDPFAWGSSLYCVSGEPRLPDGTRVAVLCKRVEQATTDTDGRQGFSATSNGAPRIVQWTYNEHSQPLTVRGPRTDADDTRRYAYAAETTETHTRGDLISITDAVGHTTHYTRYDRAGRLLESRDPNGVLTRYAYDARGRLASLSHAGQIARFTYTPAGQLQTAAYPNGAQLTYSYDAAHRLTRLQDNAGNFIAYTYDAASNLLKESIHDPAGTLNRAVTRHYDALQRIQRETRGE